MATARPEPAGVAWRLLDTPPARGAWNMAVDEALMEEVRAGAAPALRFYRWQPRCLSLGRNQPARGSYDPERLRERGIDVVRRRTGGRAVLHDQELTYAAVLPSGLLGSPRASYLAVNRALLEGLRRLGVPAEVQPRAGRRASAPSLAPCFREPAEGEVVLGGRKLIGSAQLRDDGVVLQHGSLLLGDSQHEVAALLHAAVAEPAAQGPAPDAPATLAQALQPLPSWERLTAALADGWAAAVGPLHAAGGLSAATRARAQAALARYEDAAWTWRR